jgi:hypothetical protein
VMKELSIVHDYFQNYLSSVDLALGKYRLKLAGHISNINVRWPHR